MRIRRERFLKDRGEILIAILEKEVWVTLNSTGIVHYEELNYTIPRVKKRWGLVVSIGTEIKVNVDDLQKSSAVRVTKICDMCGKQIENQKYCHILASRKKYGIDKCEECEYKRRVDSVSYEDSLEWYCIKNNRMNLLEEFSGENEKKPSEIAYGSNKNFLWNCPVFGKDHEYSAKMNNRIFSTNCPYCSNQKINHTNCLWTTHPHIAKLFKDSEIGYSVSHGTDKRADFICGECDFEIVSKSIKTVVRQGLSCPRCSDGVSYPEKFVTSMLIQTNVDFANQQIFSWSENKLYDYYISILNCIIETHGEQHYVQKFKGVPLLSIKDNDAEKKLLALENGIDNYIVINCFLSEMNYIKNSVLTSGLDVLLDLSKIDWMECHSFAVSSLVKKSSTLWEDGVTNTVDIAVMLRLSRSTVIRYLKQGAVLGWNKYNPREEMRKNGESAKGRNVVPVVKLNLNGSYVEEFVSITEANTISGVGNIHRACKENNRIAGGFKWMFKNEYEQLIQK